MTKPSVCVQTAVGKERVFAGVYGVLGLRPLELSKSPALLSLSSRPSSSSEMAIVDNSIVAAMLNFAYGEHRFQPCRFH
ncbi:unnamed protein product [Sphagnum tenellum]